MSDLTPLYIQQPILVDRGVTRTAFTPPGVEIKAFPGSGGTLVWNYLSGLGFKDVGHGHSMFDRINAKNILVFRDPRDALCSTVKRLYWKELRKGELEEAFLLCINSHPSFHGWIESLNNNYASHNVSRIKFEENFFANKHRLITRLSRIASLIVAPWYKSYLLWEFSLARNRERARNVGGELGDNFEGIDPHTHIHGHHISSGKIGAWKEAFTPRITEAVKQALGSTIIALGYEKDMNW